ncbi:hypothetical protein KOR42_39270 [Thalassoglobus neptunius]|uniref:Uncharacterized protein n=1 Tax=Thalassoglobus neptunius TaxID=1938619 RepID=A0A5C5WFX5_9PLAN|nr:hypothetical protein [Thalassoglobus neptunius]TWT49011.1 hypothetical protein KOR42_39270 [Thalassoglobus neptunius]
MSIFFQQIPEDATLRIPFTTNNTSGGATAPSSPFEAADVTIYKNGSASQKATTNGLTMTSPFDSTTGLHLLEIDTSVDTGDSGFWTEGADYIVVLNPDETVAGQAVVDVLAVFRLGPTINAVQFEWSLKATEGDILQLAVWLDRDGQTVDIDALDAAATCDITIREHGAAIGAPLYTFNLSAGTASHYEDKRFEYEYQNPSDDDPLFTSNREFDIEVILTINGVTYERNFSRIVW